MNPISTNLNCVSCEHKKWQEGDYEYSPPGYGTYVCELTKIALQESVAKISGISKYCPIHLSTRRVA